MTLVLNFFFFLEDIVFPGHSYMFKYSKIDISVMKSTDGTRDLTPLCSNSIRFQIS